MVFTLLFIFMFVELVSAGEEIVKISHECPDSIAGTVVFRIRADVPVYGEASCKNGPRLFISSQDGVDHLLIGSFDPDYEGQRCLLHKKAGTNTYTVDVEYGWGEEGSEIIQHTKTTTMSCVYDHHGDALTIQNKVLESMLAAEEAQVLVGPLKKTAIELTVMDVLDENIAVESITLGRKIRLSAKAMNNDVVGFRPVSCAAMNERSTYAFLRAGCGDGVVIKTTSGFITTGNRADSPYFQTFKLRGTNMVKFQCNFTVCKSNCDGDSCSNEDRKRRDLTNDSDRDDTVIANMVTATSTSLRTEEDPLSQPNEDHANDIAGPEEFGDLIHTWNTWSLPGSWSSWAPVQSGEPTSRESSNESLLSTKYSLLLSFFGFVLLVSFFLTFYLFVKRLLYPV